MLQLTTYTLVKNSYMHISLLYAKYKKMAAIQWPAYDILPKISTDDLTNRLSFCTIVFSSFTFFLFPAMLRIVNIQILPAILKLFSMFMPNTRRGSSY
jgi:hypothetical protein